ncbi:hypothetical protein GGR52DRAFT_568249 [Hypoxylon sp. FL1284]|nr:hypothetical protein GGR52DRAFT_568249 [Hypoxylon sp. FL1284]
MGSKNPFNSESNHSDPNSQPSQQQSSGFSLFRHGSRSGNAPNSPSGFSLRRTLSGRSQARGSSSTSGRNRQGVFGGLLSGSRGQRPQTPPPSYSQTVDDGSSSTANPAADGIDDEYAFLREFNTIFLIDDSLSMKAERRWEETQEALAAILPVCVARDADGVDVYFLNHRTSDRGDAPRGVAGTGYRNVTDPRAVQELFGRAVRPSGATPTGTRLDHILRAYLSHYEKRVAKGDGDVYGVAPINVIVVTDGQPTDEPGEVIAQAARRLDALHAPPHQIGVQFFQVGRDPAATRALRELDDDLCRRESVRDMVDTATFDSAGSAGGRLLNVPTLTADGILKVVLGAVKRKLDRKVLVRVDGPAR